MTGAPMRRMIESFNRLKSKTTKTTKITIATMSRNTFIPPHDWEASLFMSWLSSFSVQVLLFFVSACHSSTVNAYSKTTWFPQKSSLGYVKSQQLDDFFWISTSRFQSTLRFETSDFQSKNARLSSPSIWLSTLAFRVNLVSIICNFSCSTIGRSAAPKRSHSPDTGL